MHSQATAQLELVRRVAASAEFRRCPRLRQLLVFVAERAVHDPSRELRAADVAPAFARPALRGTVEAENLVRVHTLRLRERLAAYFAGSGAHEPLVIEIPMPGCAAVFRTRAPAPPSRRPEAIVAASLAALFLAASVSLALRHGDVAAAQTPPSVQLLWTAMFPARSRVALVVGAIDGPAGEPALTGMADARVAHEVGRLGAAQGLEVEILPAHAAGAPRLTSGQAIVTGPAGLNPWIAPFEARLNFRTPPERPGAFENVAPRPGEEHRYAASDTRGYCHVAWLPSLDGSGSILLLSGTDMGATEAGLALVTREAWIDRLGRELGLPPDAPFVHFEALLATERIASSTGRFDLVAVRRIDADPPGPPSDRVTLIAEME